MSKLRIYTGKVIGITPEEMNRIIAEKEAKHERFFLGDSLPTKNEVKSLARNNFIENQLVSFKMLTRGYGEAASTIYYTRKDSDEAPEVVEPPYRNYAIFRRNNKDYKEYDEKLCDKLPSASPLLDFNPDFDNTEQEAYCYDLNSAYGYAYSNIWGDFTKDPYEHVKLKENQFGFNESYLDNKGNLLWEIELEPGTFCRYAFDRLPVPQEHLDFINRWYERKRTATNSKDKAYAKRMLTIPIGYLQNVNPFIRMMVVCYCNKYIDDLLDENSLYWNTDSIVSRVRRPDLEKNMGDGLGQWKLEESGKFAHSGFNYQWNDAIDKISLRGTPNSWALTGWNLLKDGTPKNHNLWQYNKKTNRLERI